MTPQHLPLRSKIVLTFTVFVCSGCIYFSQPLLARLAQAFSVSQLQAGTITTATLLGFVSGLLFVVPLADVLDKKRLILGLLAANAVLFCVLAACQHFAMFVGVSFLLGFTAMGSQIVIPYVARLSGPHERGRNLGMVLSGALTGVLAARAVSGVVAEHLGWRAVFVGGALLMLGLGVLLQRMLPPDPPSQRLPYPQLLRSVWDLFVSLPELRRISFVGALMYAAMTSFWATLAFQLSGPSFHLGPQSVGMFGFIGAAGALSVSFAGPLADRLSSHTIVRGCIGLMMLAYVILGVAGASLAGLVLGVIVLDLAAQAATVSNQTAIYRLSDAQSRINTVYKIIYNGGGALGSVTAALAWQRGGWWGVCGSGLLLLLGAAVLEGLPQRQTRTARA